ncbi:glutamate--tRNA ligase [Truepera radiovictrix]|uniref:Glutamate--tRNA ligase n=1 Tax=Truepera radiovictrix (strain DSM 17093 / CIP 108686 / LMG 22925 / RQ-24) TaxID=649638 RepID=D7CWK7_TRURR|nr:glutamate--tRNA ligase [Truepera radiovictrix]ADI14406.1 glutamyl-tRNA synthetase [Truepera radiovictrix DSM 17093]WMT57037.1 glutamate--tRNA ligase [Truepera radiovictrix]
MTVTRIAPSPTGDPHVGTAYMSLFDYVFAKQQGGTFILRIEDTDQKRYRPEAEARLYEALRWLGLEPDESPEKGGPNAPYRQSERRALYARYAEQLLAEGKAYRAFETPEELEAIRLELQAKGLGHGYDGRARALSKEESDRRAAAGEPFAVRLVTPDEGETVVRDLLRGEVRIPNREVPDAVLLKSDGLPTYHLAVVVDDHLMGVTHAVRGEEWLPTAPIHVLLYRAFGWPEPVWVHMPVLKNAAGKKLSKRKDDTNLESYRRQGILPEAFLNYLATMGWSMPDGREFFTLEEMIAHFSFERVSLGGSIFDPKRLRFYNARYLRELPLEELARRVKPFLQEAGLSWNDEDYLLDVLEVLRPRAETLRDFAEHPYFFTEDFAYTDEAKKKLKSGQAYLEDLERAFARLDSFDEDSVDDLLHDYVQSQSVGMGKVLQPLRAALTGTTHSPGMTEVVSLLGRERVLGRLGRALTALTQGLPDDRPVKPPKDAHSADESREGAPL